MQITADSVQTLLPVWIRPTPSKGEVRVKDRTDEFGIQQFVKYIVDEVRARRQPGCMDAFPLGRLLPHRLYGPIRSQ